MSSIARIRLLLVAAILLAFGRILTNDFVDWDDGRLIYLNENISNPTLGGLARQWNPSDPANSEMYNPLVYTTWWILAHGAQLQDADLLGARLDPYIFHAASLLVHCLTACVVLEILRRLRMPDWAAATGALVFAIHPIQTEAVAWATGMKDLLSGLLAMLTIWRYLVATQSQGRQRQKNYALATLCFLGALLAKPSTVIVPLIAAIIDRVLYHRPWRDIAARLTPWLVPAAIITAIAIRVQPTHHIYSPPLWARPLIALDALAFYLYKIFLPLNLSFDYGRSPNVVITDPALHHPLYWTWIFPVVVALLVWKLRRKELTAGALIFLAGVLPVLGFTTFIFQYYTTVADRYVYLSMLGLALAVGWFAREFHGRAIVAVFSAVIVLLSSLSFVQAGRWKDSDVLYAYGLSLNNTRSIHYLILGHYEDKLSLSSYRRAALARQQGDTADFDDFIKRGDAYVQKAIGYYQKAIQLDPKQTNGYDKLSSDFLQLNQFDQAIAVVRQWMAVEPTVEPAAREKPGMLEQLLGSLYLRAAQYPQAVQEFTRSLQLQPDPDVRKLLRRAREMMAASRPTTAASP